MKSDRIDIGQRIQEARLAKNYTQAQLGEVVKLSSNHISGIETGRKAMSFKALVDICEALNVSADYILFGNRTILETSPADERSEEKTWRRLSEVARRVPEKSQDNFFDVVAYLAPRIK